LQQFAEEFADLDDEDDEEENFAWYDLDDKDTYFALTTCNKQCYKKDDQVFICYGRRSNWYLLSFYGFCLSRNKYNALKFRVNIDFGWKEKMDNREAATDEMKVSKMITLKEFKLRDEVFAYIRANLMNQREKELIEKGDTSLQD